jgi:hypothetical protein
MRAPRLSLPSCLGLLLFTLVLGYCVLRAVQLPITHDEALTFLAFCSRPWAELFSWSVIGASANNHFLNTLLAASAIRVFGAEEWTLRLSALIGCALYGWGAWSAAGQLATGKARAWVQLGSFALCVGNAYLLDFFSLSRGYGLGLGFSALGLWLLCRRIRENASTLRAILAPSFCFAAATLANLSFAYIYLSGALLLALAELRDRPFTSGLSRALFGLAPSAALLALVYAAPIRLLRSNGQFFFGGERGFLADTVASLLRAWLYSPRFESCDFTGAALLGAALFFGLGLAAALVGRSLRALAFSPGFGLLLMTAALGAGIQIQHELLGSRFVIERAAIFFFPLAALSLTGLAGFALDFGGRTQNTITGALLCSLACASLLYAASQANRTHTRDWRYAACARAMLQRVATERRPALIGTNSLLAPSLAFYITTRDLRWVSFGDIHDAPGMDYTHYLLSRSETATLARSRELVLLAACPVSEERLVAPASKTAP